MKPRVISFLILYVLVPLVVIPVITVRSGNLYGLFGIACYYAGLFMVQFRQWIFFPIPLFFCFWYWYTYGFGVRDYVTVYLFWMICGMALYLLSKAYDKYVNNVLPENEENLKYNDKLAEMEERIARYQKDHPNEKMTPEILEKIKTDIFFS